MAKETRSFVDIFFNLQDAYDYISDFMYEYMYDDEMNPKFNWMIKNLEIKLMPSGGFRAGISFEKLEEQLNLFGAEQDA